MSLLRGNPIKKRAAEDLNFNQPDPKKETKHEKAISKRVKKDKREFKSIGDMIKHVQDNILKSDGNEIAKRKKHQARVDYSIKHKHPICPDCKKTLVPVWDEKKSTKAHVIWTNQIRCINCGETYDREEMK